MKLDKFYYDQYSEESHKQIILEYVKAVNALTINDEFRLRKQIADYEDKLKSVPRVEQLQEQLASRIIEQESLKKTVEKMQREKELQDQYIRERDIEIKTVHEKLDEFIRYIQHPGIYLETVPTESHRDEIKELIEDNRRY